MLFAQFLTIIGVYGLTLSGPYRPLIWQHIVKMAILASNSLKSVAFR